MVNEKDVFSSSSEVKLHLWRLQPCQAVTLEETLVGTWSLSPNTKYSLSEFKKNIQDKYGGGKYHLLIVNRVIKYSGPPLWRMVYESNFEINGEQNIKEIDTLKNVLQSKQHLLNETLCPGLSVWSKATGKGPWITISPVEVEVGLNTGNILHQIPKVAGWIVRDNEGKDHVYPEVELTFKPPKSKELIDEISWKSKLFYGLVAVISATFSSLCYLKLLK